MTARAARSSFLELPDFGNAALACREPDVDPEVFFPLPTDSGDQARAICRRCPAKVSCGDWATWNKIDDGFWGGLSPEERKTRRRAWELVAQ